MSFIINYHFSSRYSLVSWISGFRGRKYKSGKIRLELVNSYIHTGIPDHHMGMRLELSCETASFNWSEEEEGQWGLLTGRDIYFLKTTIKKILEEKS